MQSKADILALDRAIALHDAAQLALDAGDARGAVQNARRAVALAKRARATKFDRANLTVTLGQALEMNEEPREALRSYAQAILLMRGLRGTNATHLRARCSGRQALVEQTLGRYAASRAIYRRALRAAERALGPRHPEVGVLCNDCGVLEKFAGRYDDAERLYRRAATLLPREELPGLFHNLGGLDHARGRFAAAERWARKGVTARRKLSPANDPRLLADEAALAAILAQRGKHGPAELIYRRAIRVFRKAGARYEVAVNANNLADSLADRGRNAEAARLYAEALRLKRAVLGHDHPDVALTLNNLAALRRDMGRKVEARRLFTEALKIFRATAGPDHPHTQRVAQSLALLYSKTAEP